MVWDAHRSVKTIDFSAALTEACVRHHYTRAVALPRSEASATLLPPPLSSALLCSLIGRFCWPLFLLKFEPV